MYLQCVEILAKFRIAKFGVWASPSKITGEKESGNTIWIFH